MNIEKIDVPQTLKDIVHINQEKYLLQNGYWLEASIERMGTLPALSVLGPERNQRQQIFTNDLELLEDIWNLLNPKKSEIYSSLFYGNAELNIWFHIITNNLGFDCKTAPSIGFLNRKRFNELLKTNGHYFAWAGKHVVADPAEGQWSSYISQKIARIKNEHKIPIL